VAHHVFVAPDLARIGGRLGPKTVRKGDTIRVHLVAPGCEDAVLAAVRGGHLPAASTSQAIVPVVAEALERLRDCEDDLRFLRDCVGPDGFRVFLSAWTYLAEGGLPAMLGPTLWAGQEQYLEAMLAHPWLYLLKGRQVGATTLACAFDAWHVRFGGPNYRAHLFSRREDEATELLEQATYGLDALPDWLQLPVTRSTTRIREYDAGPGDRRTLKSFPADRATGRGQTCTAAHIDEWSAMAWPQKTLASITPSVADGIGRCFILTTECVGPESESAHYYRRCEAGDGKHVSLFVSSLARPDRDEPWLETQRRSMHPDDFDREYPTTAEQALSASAERFFLAEDVDDAGDEADGLAPAGTYRDHRGRERPRKYAAGWDIGFRQDATCGIVLDHTEDTYSIAHYVYLKPPVDPGDVQRAIEGVAGLYPRVFTLIEDNNAGYSVRHNVNISSDRLAGFTTSTLTKGRILDMLYTEMREGTICWRHDECPELTREMYAFRLDAHAGDAVMALALALEAVRQSRDKQPGSWKVLQL